MLSNFNKVLIFGVGAAVGSFITWKVVKKKYEQISKEEIDSVKETYDKLSAKKMESINSLERLNDSLKQTVEAAKDKPPIHDYAKVLGREGYNKEEVKEVEVSGPYIISPDEFDTRYGYDSVTLVYYADGILENDFGDIVDEDEVDDIIGSSFMDHFGEYEEDSVFIRNETLRTDYEILRDNQRYSDLNESKDD